MEVEVFFFCSVKEDLNLLEASVTDFQKLCKVVNLKLRNFLILNAKVLKGLLINIFCLL